MPEFQVSVSIHKPIETVYQAYIDPDNMLMWTDGLEKIEIIKGEFGEIGATMHLHYDQKGRKSILEDKLKSIEEGKKIVSQVTGGGLTAEVCTVFNSLNDTTELTLTWNGSGKNLITKLFLSAMKNKIKNSAQAELSKFKELVEEHGAKFN